MGEGTGCGCRGRVVPGRSGGGGRDGCVLTDRGPLSRRVDAQSGGRGVQDVDPRGAGSAGALPALPLLLQLLARLR